MRKKYIRWDSILSIGKLLDFEPSLYNSCFELWCQRKKRSRKFDSCCRYSSHLDLVAVIMTQGPKSDKLKKTFWVILLKVPSLPLYGRWKWILLSKTSHNCFLKFLKFLISTLKWLLKCHGYFCICICILYIIPWYSLKYLEIQCKYHGQWWLATHYQTLDMFNTNKTSTKINLPSKSSLYFIANPHFSLQILVKYFLQD